MLYVMCVAFVDSEIGARFVQCNVDKFFLVIVDLKSSLGVALTRSNNPGPYVARYTML